ncbi:MAG: cell envelope integrity protein TolA [Gammaproteobacteria bacterium]|nr:cell envelope integrity protein TolA [Gammaproteobacteria bacterium]
MFGRFWKAFNNARAIVLAVVVHIIAIGILVVNMEWLDVKPSSSPKSAPIQAKVIDRTLVEKELARIEQEKKDRQAEKKRKQEQAEKEKRRAAELEKKRKAEVERKKELAEKQKQEAKRKKAVELKRKKELAAKKKKEAEAKKKKQLAEQKAAAEKKRKQEVARKKKQAAEAAKRKRIAAEQRRQKEMEQSLFRAMEDEENESRRAQITGLIRADIQNNYYIPPTAKKGMECLMSIRLLPSGDVQSVQIIKSSGSKAFDKAAEDAVFRASPLPVSVSSAGKLFNEFREFNFRFIPDL